MYGFEKRHRHKPGIIARGGNSDSCQFRQTRDCAYVLDRTGSADHVPGNAHGWIFAFELRDSTERRQKLRRLRRMFPALVDLPHCLRMQARVLPDIEGMQVETKTVYLAEQWIEEQLGQTRAGILLQALADKVEIPPKLAHIAVCLPMPRVVSGST